MLQFNCLFWYSKNIACASASASASLLCVPLISSLHHSNAIYVGCSRIVVSIHTELLIILWPTLRETMLEPSYTYYWYNPIAINLNRPSYTNYQPNGHQCCPLKQSKCNNMNKKKFNFIIKSTLHKEKRKKNTLAQKE